MQMEENQGSQPAEPGLQEVLERLGNLLQGWSRPEKQVNCLPNLLCERNAASSRRTEHSAYRTCGT